MNDLPEWLLFVLPLAVLVLLLIPPVAMVAVILAAVAAAGVAVALVGAVLALPYLLTRSLHRRWRARSAAAVHHTGAKIVGRHMSTPTVELSTLNASHPLTYEPSADRQVEVES